LIPNQINKATQVIMGLLTKCFEKEILRFFWSIFLIFEEYTYKSKLKKSKELSKKRQNIVI
jgi:hypothetical protein